MKILFLNKNEAINVQQSDMESCDKNISKIRNVALTFKKKFKNVRKIEKIHMDPEKLIDSLEI